MFLEGACHGEPTLRARLDVLLAAPEQTEGATKELPGVAAATIKVEFTDGPDETVGQKIGRYKILEKVGEGAAEWCMWPSKPNRCGGGWR